MYRAFGRGAFFFALFSKKPAKKFISFYFLVPQTRGALIHFLIPNWSEYAPDSLGARGVANPGASFFDREGDFFATNRAPDVRTKCARFHHETAKAPEPRKREARGLCCLPAPSIVESRRPARLAMENP